jgi:probable F420-dependent oxidoreductase
VHTVEELGFHHVLAYDHVLGAGTDTRPGWRMYDSETPFHEVFVLFGYLAAITTSLELTTGVLVLPQRQTALVAKQAVEVDILSRGRLRLGIGVGWNHVEYQALGERFDNRGARSEEQIEVLRALWTEPTITYNGRWHEVDNAGLNPRPARRIPIWLGGAADATLRRVARSADGWLPSTGPGQRATEAMQRLASYARDAGREPGQIGIEPQLSLARVPPADRPGFAARWAALGATHLTINTMGAGLRSVTDHVAALREAINALRTAGPAGEPG